MFRSLQAKNQQRDIIQYIQHLKPKVYYPGHLTEVAQAGSAHYHKISWRETAYNMGFPQTEWPEFRLLVDPNDFMVPQIFNPPTSAGPSRARRRTGFIHSAAVEIERIAEPRRRLNEDGRVMRPAETERNKEKHKRRDRVRPRLDSIQV